MKNSILTMLCLIWCALPGAAADISISAAKLLPDSPTTIVSLGSKIVTYASANYFYIEEDNRNIGIRVEKTAHGLQVGMRADITGTMKTNANNERAILASIATHNGDGALAPVGMNNKTLGGGNWKIVGTGGQKGTSNSIGLNNIGLLVKTWGKYQPIDATNFSIDDGAGLNIKCTVPAGTFLGSGWQYVAVTGISSMIAENSIYPHNLLVHDIQVVSGFNVAVEMISIPAGSFLMGNNGSEPYSYSNELPQHSVTLSAYSIGKYEVTRGQYRQFMNATGRAAPAYWDAVQNWGSGSFTQTDNYPVVGVTYYEAEAFCKWAGGHLPTEAQWERAARWTGSSARVYPWGDVWNNEYCNNYYDSNLAGGGYQKYQTTPVGSYSLYGSPSGCQDMAGNVWEWCQDWYKSYPGSNSPFDYTNSDRVLRGGSWNYYADDITRCAYRNYGNPYDYWNYYFGFRLARSAP